MGQPVLPAVARLVSAAAGQLLPQHCSNLLWAVARLGLQPPRIWLQALEEATVLLVGRDD